MKQYKRILFVEEHGDSRAPMAQAIFNELVSPEKMIAESRGLVVLFSTPINQKAEAVLKSNGLNLENFEAKELTADDFTEDTLVVTMEEEQRQEIERRFDKEAYVLTNLTGDELEIMNPYGAPLPLYGICFETLNATIKKLILKLNGGE